jgi:hypothetical protein
MTNPGSSPGAILAAAEARYRALRNDPEATTADIEEAIENLELAAEAAEPEWDSADSNAYQQAIESGAIPDPDTDLEAEATR